MVNQIDRYDFSSDRSRKSDNKSLQRDRSSADTRSDELISTLANAVENRRARQVNEWESMRRQHFRASA